MNFYPHHIGDYLTATVHLSWLEDCAYRRLLDVYYSREQSIPADIGQACRLVRAVTKEERKAVELVLREFFTLADGWTHGRCEEEIEKARVAAARSKANGMKGGRPANKKPKPNPDETQQVNSGLSEKTQIEPDPKAPITNPITNTNSVANATDGDAVANKAELWAAGKSLLAEQGMPERQCGSFVGKLVKDYGDTVVVESVRAAVVARPADAAEYIKAACLHAVGKRKQPESFAEQGARLARERVNAFAPAVAIQPTTEVSHVPAIAGR